MRLTSYISHPYHLKGEEEKLRIVNKVRIDRRNSKPKTQRRRVLGEKVKKEKKQQAQTQGKMDQLSDAQKLELLKRLEAFL